MIELFITGPSYLVRTELNLFEPLSALFVRPTKV